MNSRKQNSFGSNIKNLRIGLGFTRAFVCKKAQIHEDTLRKIEHGNVVPKLETLELLSIIYKVDLLEIFKSHRIDSKIINFYSKIDSCLVNNSIIEVKELRNTFEHYFNTSTYEDIPYTAEDLLSLFNFLDYCIIYYESNMSALESFTTKMLDHFKIHFDNIDSLLCERYTYNTIEIRILIVSAMSLVKLGKNAYGLKLLEFCLDLYVYHHHLNIIDQRIITKLNYLISYCYYLSDAFEKSLSIADKTIKALIERNDSYMLYNLYARKGAAEYYLNNSNFCDSFDKCLHLISMTKNDKLFDKYKKIIAEKYPY